MKASDDPLELEPVLAALPAGFDALRVEALAEGFRQVERLAADWEAGTTRFDRDGEALLAARLNGVLVGIGGVTMEPGVAGGIRLRAVFFLSGPFPPPCWRPFVKPHPSVAGGGPALQPPAPARPS